MKSFPLLLPTLLLLCSCGREEPVMNDPAITKTTSTLAATPPSLVAENIQEAPKSSEDPTKAPPAPVNPAFTDEAVISSALAKANAIRLENGLPELDLDEKLAAAAQKHAEDMKARNFFDHVNPDGVNPFQRMKAAGAVFKLGGENIAKGLSDTEAVFKIWLDSKLHRENLLQKAYRRQGIGFIDGHWAHVFAD